MSRNVTINFSRLKRRLNSLARIGAAPDGGITRLAYTPEDAEARQLVTAWMREAGLHICIDRLGSIYGLTDPNKAVVMTGSHIDTVRSAGALDGCYGVLAGLEAVQSIREQVPALPVALAVAVFCNEEGSRFTPDLFGSRYFSGEIDEKAALSICDREGVSVADALREHGPAGDLGPRWIRPNTFLELHIEQGPVLEASGKAIGVVEGVQGFHWLDVFVAGQANHAGTTPMHQRRDALAAAAEMVLTAEKFAREGLVGVATAGVIEAQPGSLNIVPGGARFSLDLRDPDAATLHKATAEIRRAFNAIARTRSVSVDICTLSAADPVCFDVGLVGLVEELACRRAPGETLRMFSGAGHDAQIIAHWAPTAMIFVPSTGGISHNPREHTDDEHLHMGAQVLCDAMLALSSTSRDIR